MGKVQEDYPVVVPQDAHDFIYVCSCLSDEETAAWAWEDVRRSDFTQDGKTKWRIERSRYVLVDGSFPGEVKPEFNEVGDRMPHSCNGLANPHPCIEWPRTHRHWLFRCTERRKLRPTVPLRKAEAVPG